MRREAVQEVSASDDSTFIPSQTCSVFDKDGKLISERRGDKNAQYVKYEDIPKNFVAAIISIEDKKFYQHNGVDLKGLVRAVKATVMSKLKKSQGGTQGGSTITMQLAKLIYMQPKPVSYTHLDVYKRQHQRCGAVGEKSAGRIGRTESGLSDSFPSGAGSCRKYRTSGRAFPGSDPGGKCQDISHASAVF